MLRYTSILFSLLLFGCSDYNITKIPEEPTPEIEVTPEGHSFGALNASGPGETLSVSISNVGTATLDIHSIYLSDPQGSFSVSSLGSDEIDPGSSEEIIVTYDPDTFQSDLNGINILSNDEDEPLVHIPLDGSGDAPIILVSPDRFDFETVLVGCEEDMSVTVSNIGNVDLQILDVEYFSSLPVDFGISGLEDIYGPFPWTIIPGGEMYLFVDYAPLDELDDAAYIEIESDDPVTPIATASQEGLGQYEGYVIDSFLQDGTVSTDILFVIDNSGSMGSNQTNLINNFDSFIGVFSAAGVDYQIGFITTDDENLVGGSIITPASTDPVAEANSIISSIGTWGSAHEKGLLYSLLATSSSSIAGPGSSFLRTDSKLAIIYVSDEPDHSSPTTTPSDVSSHLLSLKSSSDLVVAHAVAGDYPSGCHTNGGAQFGDGYYDVVTDLGGTLVSICASDFGIQLDTLARESITLNNFPLSDNPIESTIEVYVDGTAVTGWTYDAAANSVTISPAPPEGSTVDINYAIWAECEE